MWWSGAMMIPKERKRLAKVDFAIAEVSRHAAPEKSIRHRAPGASHPLRTHPRTEDNRRKE